MDIQTKFNLGDTAYTIDPSSMKLKSFEVKKIMVSTSENQVYTSLLDAEDYTAIHYDEDKCFATKEELLEYVQAL